ncbi:MAG: hypothetical protein OZ948_10285 [Deltaproteobacteria bacterium]|nr:hypothetical protein [Deltaproteobacteria bacterium]
MRLGILALAIVWALAGTPGRALATTVFERPAADPFLAGTLFSDLQRLREAATPFALSQPAGIDALVWWGGYFSFEEVPNPGTSPFEIRFFADTGAGPEATPFLVAAVTATISAFPASLQQFEYEARLPAELALGAGLWWISIVDVDTAPPTFAWRKGSEVASSFSRPPAGGWEQTHGLASVRLEGRVLPEPGPVLLAAIGLALLGARAQRHAR